MILQSIRSAVDFATHLPRYREIIHVLFKYGFAEELRLAAVQHFLKIEDKYLPQSKAEILSQPFAVRLRLALEELGPTFVKLGQILSARRDLIDDATYEELTRLQEEVPPFSSKKARDLIEKELEASIDDIFVNFQDDPIGGASIAQVHTAYLLDGQKVAIKVQRPHIRDVIEQDLAILADLASLLEKHVSNLSALNPSGIVKEFSLTLLRELDFTNELGNAQRFAKQFIENSAIKVPEMHPHLSTEKVLTMEFISGIRIDDLEELRAQEIDTSVLAKNITDLIYEQIFDYGFFHGDPHPGNMCVLPGGVTGLYDYGMMGSFSPDFRIGIAHTIAGLVEKNHRQVMRSILEMSEEGFVSDAHKMLSDVSNFAGEHLDRPLKEINLGFVLNKLLALLRNNGLRMKGSFYLGIKALSQVEAIGRMLDPQLNFISEGEPFATKIIMKRYTPWRFMKLFKNLSADTYDFLEEFPHDFRTLYQRLKRGDINFPLQHKLDPEGFEPLRRTMDSIANRLANAILAASVLICSSILVLADIPPRFYGISVIGVIGLTAGGLLCARLVFSIWKHGGL
ncbi:MAG: ABC1 kinase family protein [Chthoniobacterales bacterium]